MSSGTNPYNPFYEPVAAERYFTRRRKYDAICVKRNDLPVMVDAFEERIRDWYIEPINVLLRAPDGGHYSFAIAAMSCLLIDALSQFEQGVPQGTGNHFKRFVRSHLPSYATTLSSGIDGYRIKNNSPHHEPLNDLADVLYHGFRCGILHQAHAPLYCGIVPGNLPPQVESTGHATYAAGAFRSKVGSDCPVVVLYPEHLFDEVMAFFAKYLKNIKDKNPAFDALRDKFKWKFSDSFGIDITSAVL